MPSRTEPESPAGRVQSLIEPRSLALIGASPRRPGPILGAKRGQIPVWAVNPGRDEVLGVPCFPTVFDLPEPPDAAMMLVGHERLERAVADVLEMGTRALLVPGLGNEAGTEGPPVLEAVVARIRDAGAEMLGPNCMGIAVPDGASPWLAELSDMFVPGQIAVISQSGSIGEALACLGPRVGFRAIVSCGGEAQLGLAEFVSFFSDDERTTAIGVFVETVRKPLEFSFALDNCARRGKPVVCLKVGSSEAAARAALAHTGAIVGSDRAFEALLRRTGALQVWDLPELIETLEVLARRRLPRGRRATGVSESGGEAALLADRGTEHDLQFDVLPDSVAVAIRREFPRLPNAQNPVDAWAADQPERIYPRTLEMLAESGMFDILVAQIDLSRFRGVADQEWNRVVLEGLGKAASDHQLFAAAITTHTSDPPDWAYELARRLDIALLRGARDAAAAIARVAGWKPHVPVPPAWTTPIAIDDLLVRDGALPEHESCSILERYGVPFAARERAHTAEAAAAATSRLGAPVVVKRDGPAHKANEGGVRLNVQTPEETASAAAALGLPVLVARQVARGRELFCGGVRDDQYGPVIVIGAGGTAVETVRPPSAVLGPLSDEDADRLVREAGLPDPNGVLASAAVAVSRLMEEHSDVVEVDINPIVSDDELALAVDGLIVVERGRANDMRRTI